MASSTASDSESHGNGHLRRSGPVRVFVIDDHPAIREALRETLGGLEGVEYCGDACSALQALESLPVVRPDLAIVDLSLPDTHGLRLVEEICLRYPELLVIVYSIYDESVYAESAILAGASGYLSKTRSPREIATAIRTVLAGDVYVSHHIASKLLHKIIRNGGETLAFAIDEFTEREMTVFRLLGEGRTVSEIADCLNLNAKTVETYRRRAKEKLGLGSVNDLIQYAVQWTYKHPSPPPVHRAGQYN